MKVETFLDYNQILKVIFEITGENIEYSIICSEGKTKLTENIIENIMTITALTQTENPDIYRLSINDAIFIDISKSTGEIINVNKLTAFETRLLSQGKTNLVPFSREGKTDFMPLTDLHTHFAGAIRPDSLINVGLQHNIQYPIVLLKKLGIDVGQYESDGIDQIELRKISESDLEKLKAKLRISPVTQETFNKMEDIYSYRGPFTKNKTLFPDYLRELAKDYKENGITYTELSFSAFISDPQYMEMLEENLPQIEAETGVKLRFLAGLWRHSDHEWNLDDADRIMKIAQSPYIVGCDFMGHETNSTDTFTEELKMFARYAMEKDPEFAIRVHAGENPMFKENVKKVLEIIYNEHSQIESEKGADMPMPRVRIGHGLYGVDEQVLEMAKKMHAIIEFNMSSNLALNNINSILEIPIKKYIGEGISVVLGTDGHGMYSTHGEQETLLATAAGLSPEDFNKIRETEIEVIERAIKRESMHPQVEDISKMYEFEYSTESGSLRYTKEVEQDYRELKSEASKHLEEKISSIGAITDEKTIEEDTSGKIPLMITGASKSNWPNISPEDQEKIQLLMQVIVDVLDPEKAYIVTGGTNYGVEKTMHEAVYRRNQIEEKKMVCLGTLTMEATSDATGNLEKNTVTHATILEIDGKKAANWQELPDTQLQYVGEKKGHMIAIGGGGVVNDMIQRAHNLNINMHLMDGPYGASTNKSKSLIGNNYSFISPEELLIRLYESNPEIFVKEFSLEKIEEYISQSKMKFQGRHIETDNPANFGLGEISKIDQMVTNQERKGGIQELETLVLQSKNKYGINNSSTFIKREEGEEDDRRI